MQVRTEKMRAGGHILILAVWGLVLALCPSLMADGLSAANAARLQAAIAGDHRAAKNKARDQYRHPFETLSFFGIEPGMSVVEIYPGRGWYTEILGPYLTGAGGRLYAASWDRASTRAFIVRALKGFDAMLAARPDLYGAVTVTELSRNKTDIAPAGSTDRVLTFRNVHNWMKRGYERAIFEAMFRALKPGGILGLTEHRGDPEAWQDPQALSGYVNQETVIEIAEAAGFKFLALSEVNANPRDTKNHPKGVWTLPPSLRLKDKDRAKYLAIGESDRMTLKFLKPLR